jgi:hypothetical protein
MTQQIPHDVLAAGRDLFTDEASLREWLGSPALWADGKTPWQLIADGKFNEVVGALRGLANGHFL